MRRFRLTLITVTVMMLLVLSPARAQQQAEPDFLDANGEKAKIMLLGTFHFSNPGHDQYQPKYTVDILSPKRQKQIAEILRLLEDYQPTKIAVEVKRDPPDTLAALYPKWMNLQGESQMALDSLYQAYLAGTFDPESSFVPKSSEIYQLGFRLAKRLGHERLYAVDATIAPFFMEFIRENEHRIREAFSRLADAKWEQRYRRISRYTDSLKMTRSLRETLLYKNSSERIRKELGDYLVGTFKMGGEESYLGPDFASRWWNRNLRIFRNLQRITESPDDRILVIIGAGHLTILRHLVQASPEYELVEVEAYLGYE